MRHQFTLTKCKTSVFSNGLDFRGPISIPKVGVQGRNATRNSGVQGNDGSKTTHEYHVLDSNNQLLNKLLRSVQETTLSISTRSQSTNLFRTHKTLTVKNQLAESKGALLSIGVCITLSLLLTKTFQTFSTKLALCVLGTLLNINVGLQTLSFSHISVVLTKLILVHAPLCLVCLFND